MKQDIAIRPYEASDYDDALQITYELYHTKLSPYLDTDFDKGMAFIRDTHSFPTKPFDGFFVATVNNKVAGVMRLVYLEQQVPKEPIPNLFPLVKKYGIRRLIRGHRVEMFFKTKVDRDEVYVDYIVVSDTHRSMGIGSLLLKHGEEFAKDKQKTLYTLHVIDSNPRAKKLYLDKGFIIYEKHRVPRFIQRKLLFKYSYSMKKKLEI